jgi:hypothetical protein
MQEKEIGNIVINHPRSWIDWRDFIGLSHYCNVKQERYGVCPILQSFLSFRGDI